MAENSENIEAKLCAYVEGDLDAAGRVEIEKHLEQHPNHRRLLAELTTTRDLLRQLPREQAPSELAEAFNAQLERSALLDSPVAEANSTDIRGNLLPRLLAMAAIVLLTVGLGVVVYFALPHGGSRTQLAMPDAATRPVDDGAATLYTDVTPVPSRAPAGEVAEKRGGPTTEGALAGAGGGGGADRMFKGGPPAGAPAAALPAEVASNFAPTSPTADAIARIEGKAGRPPTAPVYVLVTAADKMQAVRDATTLLADNSIHWTPAPDEAVVIAPEQAPALQGQSGQQQEQVQQADSAVQQSFARNQQQQVGQQQGSTYAQVELNNALVKKQQQRQVGAGQMQAQSPRVAEVPPVPDAVAEAGQQGKQKAEADRAAGDVADRRAESSAASPSQRPADMKELRADIADATEGQTQALTQLAPADLALRADVSAIKARMTRAQVVELSRALNRGTQQVELIADDPQIQFDNGWLQEQQRQPMPSATTRDAIANDGPVRPWDRELAMERPTLPAAAAAPTTRPSSPINLKAGPGPTTRPGAGQVEVAAGAPAPQRTAAPPGNVGDRERQMNMRQGAGPGARPERIRAGEKLNITVDELAAPGVDRTAVAEVGPDGMIRLPKLNDPLRVDGLTRAQAESVIGDAYKRSAGLNQATVRVEPADAPLANAARPAPPAAAAAQQEVATATPGGRGGVGPRPDAPQPDRVGGAAGDQPAKVFEPTTGREQVASRGRDAAKNDGFAGGIAEQDLGATSAPAPATIPAAGSDEESVEVVILVQGNTGNEISASPPQSQPAPADDVAPSDEADVQPSPSNDIPAPNDGAVPNSAAEPTAPAENPSELTKPNE